MTPTGTNNDVAAGAAAVKPGALDGRRYLEGLRDGREVWFRGERVKDVAAHPAFSGICRSLARIYDRQSDPATRRVMTFEAESGLRASYSYHLPRSAEDVLARRRNAEIWARESFGMMGRYPDFCAAIVVGFFDVREELAAFDPAFARNVVEYHAYARDHDICLSHGLHDPSMDKSARPEQDPDRCLRIVKERDDGLVVRGARFSTLAPVTHEIVVAPTYPLNEREADHAVWFAVPIATRGLKLVCRESFAAGRSGFEHPASTHFDEQDALAVFDDVLVPWERVFLARRPLEAGRLFRERVMSWAGYSSLIQLLARLELMIGVAHLLVETAGMGKRPLCLQELGELVVYAELLRGALRGAETDCRKTPGGLMALAPTSHLRAFLPMISERLVSILEHLGTSSLVFTPTEEDFRAPELRPYLELYGRGKDASAEARIRLCKLAWELTGDSFGGRQQLYERLHAGDPAVIAEGVYQRYDKTAAVEQVRRLLALNGAGA